MAQKIFPKKKKSWKVSCCCVVYVKVKLNVWQYPEIGRQYEIKNKAAIAFQCKLNGKLIAALLYILYSIIIW